MLYSGALVYFLFQVNYYGYGQSYIVSKLKPKIDILVKKDIKVPYGRSVALKAEHLAIRYDKTGHCKITVLKNDPFSSRIGSIIPSQFPCDFQPTTIFYQHYGSMTSLNEKVKLQIQLDTQKETIARQIHLNVNVIFDKPLEILNKIESLIVDELGGLSEPIGPSVLSFKFNDETQDCRVRFIPKDNGPPFYGHIVNTSNIPLQIGNKEADLQDIDIKLNRVACKEFLNGSLRYAHKRMATSSNRDYVPLVIELCDKKSEEIRKREFFQMPVRIRRAPDNQRPIINYNSASYSLQVDQIVLTALTSAVMKAEDRETQSEAIVFNVTQNFNENEGYFVHTEDPTQPVTKFLQRELDELKIAYKPPTDLSTTQRLQQIWLEALDGEGASSPRFYVIIVIKPMNSYAPQVIRNLGLSMFEGQSRSITREALEIRDPNNDSEVKIAVMAGLFNGRVEKNGAQVNEFSIEDIDQNLVRYTHDDSDTYSDSIVFKITDGTHEIRCLFLITIIPRDDQYPRLTYNTGLAVREGGSTRIDQFDLSASDVDSDNTAITFKVIEPPKNGQIFLRKTSLPDDIKEEEKELWENKNNGYEKKTNSFTQIDIILGSVFYRHSDEEKFYDYFLFRVFDNAEPPNHSGLETVIVDISSVDDEAPERSAGCPLSMNILEEQISSFSKAVLQYTDLDTNDNDLVYQIRRPPYYTGQEFGEGSNIAGHIALAHDPDIIITTFTQKQVNHFKVVYVPPKSEIGVKSAQVKFEFLVSDLSDNLIDFQVFSIKISPVNNKAPVLIISPARVDEGKTLIITSANLDAVDEDNNDTELSFTLKKLAAYGSVFLGRKKMRIGDSISLDEIRRGSLSYMHDGSETTSDEIKLVLSDGFHVTKAHLNIGRFS